MKKWLLQPIMAKVIKNNNNCLMKIQTYQPLVWKETLSGQTIIAVLWFYFGVAQKKQMSYAAFQGERVLKKYHFHCIKTDQPG